MSTLVSLLTFSCTNAPIIVNANYNVLLIGEEINTDVIESEASFSPHVVKQYLEDRKGIFMLRMPGQ